MKIKGVIRVEEVDLHIDIEVADTAQNVYVTNVHSSTLVIPPELLELRYLALSKATLNELEAKKIRTLADLVDPQGNLRRIRLTAKAKAEIEQVLGALRNAALVFNWNEDATMDLTVIDPEILSSRDASLPEDPGEKRDQPAMNGQVKNLKLEEMLVEHRRGKYKRLLSTRQLEALHGRGVTTVGDLIELGEETLLMTRGFDLIKITEVNRWFESRVTSLPSEVNA